MGSQLFPFVECLISTFFLDFPHTSKPPFLPPTHLGSSLESIHKVTIVIEATKFPLDLQLLLSSPAQSSTFTNIHSLSPK
jgi:hypothetical protein